MIHSARPTLVVVDDEPNVLGSLHDLFRKDYLVKTFDRAPDALEAMDALDPAVVLSDQRMPYMTGVDFLRRVRDLRPDATRLLVTGYADIKAVIDSINEGHVFRYLDKPWEPEEMTGAVRQAVDHHHLLVERRKLIEELKQTNSRLEESNARLEQANSLKRAFIEVASHELNTPVAVILGMTDLWEMMPGKASAESQSAWLKRIQSAGKRLAGTVERMLKLLRADRFDEPLVLRSTDLDPLIRHVVNQVQPFLEARHQTVQIEVAPGLGTAEIDPAKVGDVLTNLLVNAIKFTADGGEITILANPEGEDFVRIRVKDHGVGIELADRAHLFEPFFTGYDTMHHSSGEYQFCKKGIGLGLCLVKTFVELHGGSVDFQGTEEHGSTFGITLPRHPPRRRPPILPQRT